jgi:formylglycine-generating enzyme required for sulfatase activity
VRHWLVALLIFASVTAAAADEPARLALLIGNKGYTPKVGPLHNPHADVDLVASALRALHFNVKVLKDANYRDMEVSLRRYADEVRHAGRGAISFFYYSGHGVANPETQVNYLIPIDISDADDDKIWFESLPQSTVVDYLSRQAPFAIHYVVFDACRNELNLSAANTKSLADKGFVPLIDTSGLLIAYATAPRQTASDLGAGGGPYAKALAAELIKPGIEAVSMFRNVQIRIKQTIGQDPWLSFPSLPPIFLAGAPEVDVRPQPIPAAPASSEAERAWGLIKDHNKIAELEAYIRRFGDSFYGDLAKMRLAELKAAENKRGEPPLSTAQPEAGRVAMAEPKVASDAASKAARAQGPLTAGQSFSDCENCPEMIVVPTGAFLMGSPERERGRKPNEGPQHRVMLKHAFAVAKFEVTFAEWAACVAGGGCRDNPLPNDEGWGRSKHPVIHVSWDDATSYAAWLSKHTGKPYRLLTEAEWEYAARAGTQTPFVTGATISTERANFDGNFTYGNAPKGAYVGKTVEVGSYRANAFGLHDMHGNVWEWVEDCYKDSYLGAPTDGSAVAQPNCEFRVLRGGSWRVDPLYVRSAYRHQSRPSDNTDNFGFRIARTP